MSRLSQAQIQHLLKLSAETAVSSWKARLRPSVLTPLVSKGLVERTMSDNGVYFYRLTRAGDQKKRELTTPKGASS